MKQEAAKYCHTHQLTTYEMWCKAYADFLNRPLTVREYGKMLDESREYLAHHDTEIPHFVKRFLEKERKRLRAA